MKNLSRATIVAAMILTAVFAAQGQSQLLTNPANLSQFPSVDRIRAGTQGKDEVDSHARFMAALDLINGMIIRDLVQAPNGGEFDVPPAAERVQSQYSSALTRFGLDSPPPAARDPKYGRLLEEYGKDPAFFDSLLTQFFTPRFRADYYAWMKKPVPAQTKTTAGGAPKATTLDPSIAKAKAMNVDISVFSGSITLGDVFALPSCPPLQINILGIPEPIKAACDATDRKLAVPMPGLAEFMIGLVGAAGADTTKRDPNLRQIALPQSSVPAWVSGTEAWVRVDDQGRVVAVIFATKGLTVQKNASEDLIAKYGKMHISQGGTFKTDGGHEFKYEDLEWILPGIHVEYDALMSDENERSSVNGIGRVRIETETEYSRRKAEESKPKKRVL